MSIILKSGSSGNLAVIDANGSLYVAASPNAISSVAAPWTSATLVNAAIALMSTGGFPSVLVQLNQTSTITGGDATFEGTFDDINWQTLGATQVLDPTTYTAVANPYTFVANTNKTFLVQTNGMQQIRLRLSTIISGTGSVTIYSTLQAVDYGPASQLIVGTVAVTQSTSPWVVSLASTTITGTVAVTQSTSPWIVAGSVASGSADSGNPVKTGGVFNTTQPTVTNGQRVDNQNTARGAQIVATGVDTFNVTVNAPLPAGTNVIGHVITDSGSTTAVTGTVTISGTVTANIGTTGGITVAQGSTTSGQSGPLVQGAVTTAAPAYSTAQTSPLSLTTAGALRIDGSGSTQPVSGTITANAGTGNFTVVQATASNLNATVVGTGTFAVQAAQSGTWNIGTVTTITNPVTSVGAAASGSAKSGNPVQGGAVFNTTQPTVTNGQVVENQATARGALIVATGVDAFTVTLASTTITGTVAVTQSTSPWVVSGTVTANAGTGNFTVVQATAANLNATVVGTGTFAVQAAQSGTWTVQQGTPPWSQVGTLTHNNAAPAANNIGVLPAVASSAVPTYTNLDQVLLSTDLSGNLRVAGSLTVTDADTVGTLVALNALNVTATVTTTGQGGVGVLIAAGTLAATVVPEVSYDGGTTWVASVFFDPSANATSANLVFTNPNSATTRTILIDGGVSNARVRVSAFTSGTANATLRSTFNAGGQYVNQGGTWSVSIPGTVAVTQSTSPWVVSGTVTVNAGTGNFTVVQATAANLNATVVGTGTFAVQASQVGGPWTQNLTQVAGTALGATAVTNFGTAPAAAAVMGVNASIYAGTTGITATGSSVNANITNTVPVTLTSTTITGTVAVTQSTTPWTVAGAAASGAAKSGNPVQIGGVFNTTQPTVTTGQAVELQATARGAQIVSTGVDTFNVTVNAALPAGTNVIGHVITDSGSTTVVTGTVAVTQSGTWTVQPGNTPNTTPWLMTINQGGNSATVTAGNALKVDGSAVTQPVSLTSTTITGTVAVTQSTSPWTIAGDSASGAANAGNPVKVGGAFNTTQPTVTNGQTVDAQYTARGAQIVATGVDAFAVNASQTGTWNIGTVTAVTAITNALPAGTNVIGHVITDTGSTTAVTGTVTVAGTVTANQGGAPWSQNLTQVAGTTLGATAVTNFGTAPAATAVPGVNANIYSAGAAITAAAPLGVQLSQGNAVISNTNPIFSSITDGTTKAGVIAGTTALKTDLSSVAGTATVTAAAGVAKVGIVGNTAATLDSANTAATAPTNALLTSAMYNSTVPALTNGQAVAAEADTTGSLYQNSEGRKQSYRVGMVGFTPIASATAPAISMTGSATKTIRITRIRLSATAGTGTAADIALKRFTALSGGTANTQAANVAKMDSGNAAQTAVVNQWSAAATTATAAGILNAERYEIVTAAVSVLPGAIEWTFGDKNGQSLVLRGTSEFAGFLFSAVGTTPVADFWIEWTEE